MNLVVNARDAMPDGGRIHIKTEGYSLVQALDRDRATIPAGEYISVTVTDEGCGIATDKLTKFLNRFIRQNARARARGLACRPYMRSSNKQGDTYLFKAQRVRGRNLI